LQLQKNELGHGLNTQAHSIYAYEQNAPKILDDDIGGVMGQGTKKDKEWQKIQVCWYPKCDSYAFSPNS
jgi:hypothetical protein